MEKIDRLIGNFTTQSNKDFPLDCETLEALQGNTTMLGLLGNIAGDKVILSGCEKGGAGSSVSEGYVYLKTRAYPEGEVLRWEGGSVSDGVYVKTEDVAVSAMGGEYPKAYTKRTLAPGIGEEKYQWSEFEEIRNMKDLKNEINRLRSDLSRVAESPLGVVEMWAGVEVPEGYVLCDGQELKQADYPELYGVIGNVFNNAANHQGFASSTKAGNFRVPDLRGRFVVGCNNLDADYRAKGLTGGEKQHLLKEEEIPPHQHRVKDYVQKVNGSAYTGIMAIDGNGLLCGGGSTTEGIKCDQTSNLVAGTMQWIEHSTEKNNSPQESHENRPPYYVLAYIMRAR